jgi:multiple sugar transport system permease protein
MGADGMGDMGEGAVAGAGGKTAIVAVPAVGRTRRKILVCVLALLCMPVWWAVWFIISGSLLSADELDATLGPVLSGADGTAAWSILPSWPTLRPIAELLLDTPQFFVMFWNSVKLAIPSILGQLFIGAPAAWALSRLRFRGRKQLFLVYIVLMLMPFQVTMVPNYLVIDRLGMMDTLLAVILPFAFSAFPVFIMAKNFDAVPQALLEAAAIDGAGPFTVFLRIGLPLGLPGILAAVVLGFLECWSAVEQPMTFLQDPALWPLSLYLPEIAAEKLGLAMAASLMMLAPAALIFLFGQKYLELGIQAIGIKE